MVNRETGRRALNAISIVNDVGEVVLFAQLRDGDHTETKEEEKERERETERKERESVSAKQVERTWNFE